MCAIDVMRGAVKATLVGLFSHASMPVVQAKWLDSLKHDSSPARDGFRSRVDLLNVRARDCTLCEPTPRYQPIFDPTGVDDLDETAVLAFDSHMPWIQT